MKLSNDYLLECGFEVDVEMNLSVHYYKDDILEIIDYSEMDFEKDCNWELIIFGKKKINKYNGVRLIASVDDVDKIKQLLVIYDINPNKYFK